MNILIFKRKKYAIVSVILFCFICSYFFTPVNKVEAASWYNASWNNRIKITQDHTKVPSTQTDIPVYVDLYGMPTAFFSHVLSTGADIRVTTSDGTTEVAIQVVAIDTGAKTGQLWFKAPSLSTSTDTEFYIYYGNSGASAYATTDTYGRNAVWSNGFKGVYHLETGATAESSGNFSSATDNGSGSGTGKIGLDRTFSGTSSYINTGDISPSNWANVTVEAWVYLTGTTSAYYGVFYKNAFTDLGRFLIRGSDGLVYVQNANGNMLSASGAVARNTRVKVSYVYDQTAGYEYVYVNGTQVASRARTGDIVKNTTNLWIGRGYNNDTYAWEGAIDEFRISNVARSADWRTTSHNNENSPSTFYSVGTEEVNQTAPTVALNAPTDTGTVATLTPDLTFTGTDAEGNAVTYQVQIDTVNTFDSVSGSPLRNKVSGTDPGFTDITNGAGTNPYASGDQVKYTVQTALTNGTTYYWRVRGKDPGGSNTYGSWGTTRSFVAVLPGVTIVQSAGSTDVTEAGPPDTYTVKLNSQPTNDVVITVTPNSQVTSSPASLTFTSVNWSITQTVTVTAVNDAVVEGAHTGTISHTAASSDLNYNGISIASVTANITDNDTAGVTIVQSAGSTDVTEAGPPDTYTVKLNSQPTNDVVITVTPNSQVTSSPASLTFTSVNWATTQTVTVTAVDDAVVEGAHTGTISHTAASSDLNYNGISIASVTANITDNDTAGITVTELGGSTSVSEDGTTDTYTVVLNTQPTSSVTVNISMDSQIYTDVSSLTFTTGDWSTPQTVTVGANADAVAEGTTTSTITQTVSSSDLNYDLFSIPDISVSVGDNDTADVIITQSGGTTNVTEGGSTDSYDIALGTQPTASVTVNISSDAQVTTSPTTLTFTTVNWATTQTVIVTAVDDAVVEGSHTGTISHTSTSSDPNYNAFIIASVTANITDNDSTPPPPSGGGGGGVSGSGSVPRNQNQTQTQTTVVNNPAPVFVPVIPKVIDNVKIKVNNAVETIKNVVTGKNNVVYNSQDQDSAKKATEEKLTLAPIFSNSWQLISPDKIENFVFAPLPTKIQNLADTLPKFNSTLAKLDVNRLNDLTKLQNTTLQLPNQEDLSNDVALLPKAQIFARTPGGVDMTRQLSVDSQGETKIQISSIPNKPLELSIRPDNSVKNIVGYLTLKSVNLSINTTVQDAAASLAEADQKDSRANFLASAVSSGVFKSKDTETLKTDDTNGNSGETVLVTQQFDYTDPDGDGTYTATIETPKVPGTYEVLTVMNYKDPDLISEQLHLTTVIDPEGYIFENIDNRELRIPDATVTLFMENQNSDFVPWPAKDFSQTNPQKTGVTGQYSFLVPAGNYYLGVEAKGYDPYKGDQFVVSEGQGVHRNIKLTAINVWYKKINWVMILLGVIIILLGYNFYRDRKERIK